MSYFLFKMAFCLPAAILFTLLLTNRPNWEERLVPIHCGARQDAAPYMVQHSGLTNLPTITEILRDLRAKQAK